MAISYTEPEGVICTRAGVTPIRFAIDGREMFARDSAINQTTALYQVPTGKQFLLVDYTLSMKTTSTGTTPIGQMYILQGGQNVYRLAHFNGGSQYVPYFVAQSLMFPMTLNPSSSIQIYSGAAYVYVYGSIHGYEVDIP